MFGFITFLLMFVLWIILSGKFDLFHLSLGVISSVLVARISGDLFCQDRQTDVRTRIGQAWRFARYVIWLVGQIVFANIDVVKLALTPRKTEEVIDPHILSFKTQLKTPFAQFVLANSITLTPGTVTIRIQDDTFYVHAITPQSAGDLADAPGTMERWVAWVFEGGKR